MYNSSADNSDIHNSEVSDYSLTPNEQFLS
jgi:hypothetical protein